VRLAGMRIRYDHQLFSLQNVGGASRYHYELLRYLSTVPEVETELFLGMSGAVYPFQDLLSPKTRVTRFPEFLQPGTPRYAVNEFLQYLVTAFRGTADIYHCMHCRIMPLVRARRIVVTHQDSIYERFPVFKHTKQVLQARRKAFKRADAIICISEATRKDLIDFYGVNPSKTHVIHLGVAALPRSPTAAGKLRQLVRRDYLLYVGKRGHHKNFTGLLKAFRDSGLQSELDLLVLGGGPLTPEEAAQTRDFELNDQIIWVPRVSDSFLAEAYAGAKLFVYPSLWEGFGLPPLEAMAAGCAVLACDRSSIPEICRDAPFYFDPADQASFTRALLRAINDEEARERAATRGTQVASEYSWEKCGRETLAFYRECL
jgi:glycosyltransferase involved in cell wall biosynthesis